MRKTDMSFVGDSVKMGTGGKREGSAEAIVNETGERLCRFVYPTWRRKVFSKLSKRVSQFYCPQNIKCKSFAKS